jgi:Icc-related predicted phosphoesterase
MAETSLKTRILIISDTHCASLARHEKTAQELCPAFKSPLPAADLLIHCGDLTHTGKPVEYHQTLDMLKEIDAPVKLVIAGNHDLTLDENYVLSHTKSNNWTSEQASLEVKQTRDLWTATDGRARVEGITFLNEGTHQIDLPNGARVTVYANPYTPEFQDWGFPYERGEDRFNSPARSLSDAKNIALHPVPERLPIDIMITHGPPWACLDKVQSGEHAGCPHLLRALMHARPLIHCFGHIHESWGAKLVRWSDAAEQTAASAIDTASWKRGGWRAGVSAGCSSGYVQVDVKAAEARNAAYLDLSSGNNLLRGQQTAVINAAIMTVSYEPNNAPWLLDLDLPERT